MSGLKQVQYHELQSTNFILSQQALEYGPGPRVGGSNPLSPAFNPLSKPLLA
jgi:hypothetical protein